MIQNTNVHLDKKESYEATVRRSSDGGVWISLRELTIFCTPEQALKLSADILQGVLTIPTAEEAQAIEEENKKVCPF